MLCTDCDTLLDTVFDKTGNAQRFINAEFFAYASSQLSILVVCWVGICVCTCLSSAFVEINCPVKTGRN